MSDLISRAEAIRMYCKAGCGCEPSECGLAYHQDGTEECGVVRFLKSVPSAEKTGKWIPVSERLPEEDTEVLICYKYREGEGDTNHARIDITSYGDMYFGGNRIAQTKHWRQPFEYFALNYEVVAWMPLPEPYKGQTNCGARMLD